MDLAGVLDDINGLVRVGALPREKLLVSVGESVMGGVGVAFEYSRLLDYPVAQGGTGRSGTEVFSMLTCDW